MLEASPVRTYEEVRQAIDAKLGSGLGLSAADAAKQLTPVEHVVWALDNLLACLFEFRLHIWDQGFAQEGYDGPRTVAAIAQVARDVDPTVAELLLWTVEWVKTRGVALTSFPPELWAWQPEAARRFLVQVAERWPEGLELSSVLDPRPFQRPARRTARVGFTERGAGCEVQCPPERQHKDGVFRAAAWALWRSGADDEQLQAFFDAYFAGDEVDAICRFVSFDGDGGDEARKAALRALIRPVHPLTAWLGAEPPRYGVVLVDSLEDAETRLGGWTARRLEGPDVKRSLQWALRTDPDVLLLEGALISPDVLELIAVAAETGHLVFVGGRGPGVDLLAQLPAHVQVVDRRKS